MVIQILISPWQSYEYYLSLTVFWDSAVSMQQLHINTQSSSNYKPDCKNLTDVTPMLSPVLGLAVVWGLHLPYDTENAKKKS